jgi:hypothetical protein
VALIQLNRRQAASAGVRSISVRAAIGPTDRDRMSKLSPLELKDTLIKLAANRPDR